MIIKRKKLAQGSKNRQKRPNYHRKMQNDHNKTQNDDKGNKEHVKWPKGGKRQKQSVVLLFCRTVCVTRLVWFGLM